MSDDAERALSDAQRHQLELLANASREPVPRWYFPFLGVATGVTIATIDLEMPWVTIVVGVVLSVTVGASVGLLQNRAGFSPRLSALPDPLRRHIYRFLAGATILMLGVLTWAGWATDSPLRFTIAGLVCGLIVWVGGISLERRYRATLSDLARAAGVDGA